MFTYFENHIDDKKTVDFWEDFREMIRQVAAGTDLRGFAVRYGIFLEGETNELQKLYEQNKRDMQQP